VELRARIVLLVCTLSVGLGMAFVACPPSMGATATATASTIPLPTDDPFYTWTKSLKNVKQGTVLRSRPITLTDVTFDVPVTTSQVLYRTTGQLGQPTVTVTTLVQPRGSTKIVSYQMAYDALGAQCDPSYTLRGGNTTPTSNGFEMTTFVTKYVNAGYTAVISDYEGKGLHYVAGQEEGYNTLDGITAAENALKLPGSTPVAMLGYSGGAIATPFAAELAAKYAPRLNIVGAATGGVLVAMQHNLVYVNGTKDWSGAIPAVLVALGRAFGVTNSRDYESALGMQIAAKIKNQCIVNFLGAYPGLKVEQLVKPEFADIFSVPQIARVANQLIMGRTGAPKFPVFIATGNSDGIGDGVMLAADTEALASTYCKGGTPVEYVEYKGLDHMAAILPYSDRAFTFLSDLLEGKKVANGCSSVGKGSSLAPLRVPTVRLRFLGARKDRVTVQASTNGVTMKALVIELRRDGKRLATQNVAELTARKRTLVLSSNGKTLSAGRYTVAVTQARAPVSDYQFTIR
jgi:hypothetical protein